MQVGVLQQYEFFEIGSDPFQSHSFSKVVLFKTSFWIDDDNLKIQLLKTKFAFRKDKLILDRSYEHYENHNLDKTCLASIILFTSINSPFNLKNDQ